VTSKSTSSIPVEVRLGAELSLLTDQWRPIGRQFSWRVETSVAAVLDSLGIPGTPNVELKSVTGTDNLGVLVHGRPVGFSLELLRNLGAYLWPSSLGALQLTSSWGSEIKNAISEADLAEFLARLVIEVVKQKPDTFFSDEQTSEYLRRAGEVSSPDEEGGLASLPLDRVASILRYILKLKLSIADAQTILKHISDGIKRAKADHDIAEMLVPRISPGTIEIAMNASYVDRRFGVELAEGQSISVHDARLKDTIREQFKMAADTVFYELGIRLPDIALTLSRNIKEPGFAIKLNDVGCSPHPGLEPDQWLVNDTVDRLRLLGVEALSATNPANDNQSSIINEKDKQTADNSGLYVWDQIGYVILSLAKELRRNAWRLLHVEAVEYDLARLHLAFPDLVLATLEKISLTHLTRILRELLRDEVSIRDLRAILERILTYDYVVTDPTNIVFDDRLAFSEEPQAGRRDEAGYYAQHVRAGLKRYLTHKLTRGQNTLIVYLLDPDLEIRILGHLAAGRGAKDGGALTPAQLEEILAAIRSEVGSMPATAVSPVILTISEIRAFVREIVADEVPNLFVASYDELSPDSNIQPIARISL